MKLFRTLALLLTVAIVASSCGGDDENNPDNDTIIGDWNLIELEIDVTNEFVIPGAGTTTQETEMEGKNLNYVMSLDGSDFSTSGSYDLEINTMQGGISLPTQTTTVDNISGMGSYTIEGNLMKIMGSLFEYDSATGTTLTTPTSQEANITINNGVMTLTQVQTQTIEAGGATSNFEVRLNSTLEKK